jgi:hypothetical protein
MMRRYLVVTGLIALLGLAVSASAIPIVGEMNITGSVVVNATDLNFIPPSGPGAPPCGGGETGFGCFATNLPDVGYFTGISPFANAGQSRDLTVGPGGAAPLPQHIVVGGPMPPVVNFLGSFVVPGFTTLGFDLTFVPASGAPICTGFEAVNQSCTPSAGNPLTLKNTGTGVEVDFGVFGNFHAHGGADFGAGLGVYTTQLVGATIAGVLTTIDNGGSIAASYSANFKSFDTTVPEPATLLTFGLGSVALGAIRRRRAAKKN